MFADLPLLVRVLGRAVAVSIALAAGACAEPPRCAGSDFDCPEEWLHTKMRVPSSPALRTVEHRVADDVTGLEWQRSVPERMYSWDDAKDYCRDLRLDGYEDWRLPSRIELITLVEYERVDLTSSSASFADAVIDRVQFPATDPAAFWTATYSPGISPYGASSGDDLPWTVSFRTGYLQQIERDVLLPRVRCVRTKNPAARVYATSSERYVVRPETVVDSATGLVWQRGTNAGVMTEAEGTYYCERLALDGTSGFRLPHVKELLTIVSATTDRVYSYDRDVFRGSDRMMSATAPRANGAGVSNSFFLVNRNYVDARPTQATPVRCVR